MAIDIGAAATDRTSAFSAGNTRLTKLNPANGTGTLTSFEVWCDVNLVGFYAGTFFLVAGTTYECRDSENIGAVAAGSKQTFSGLNCDVVAGDLVGNYYTGGNIDTDIAGGAGVWYVVGEYIDPGDQAVFTSAANYEISLYGTGGGWSGTIAGVTNPTSIMGVDVANIASVKGVASA